MCAGRGSANEQKGTRTNVAKSLDFQQRNAINAA